MKILESNLYRILDKITNFFFLNIIWLLFSLPFFTIFPATAAMFAVIRDWSLGKEERVFKPFFKYFKANFKYSFIYQLIFLVFVSIFYVDIMLMNELSPLMSQLIFIILLTLLFIVMFVSMYLFPVMVHYDLKFKGIVRQAFMFSLMYFPTTLLAILLFVATVFLVLYFPVVIVFVFSVTAYLIFKICLRNFNKVTPFTSKSSITINE